MSNIDDIYIDATLAHRPLTASEEKALADARSFMERGEFATERRSRILAIELLAAGALAVLVIGLILVLAHNAQPTPNPAITHPTASATASPTGTATPSPLPTTPTPSPISFLAPVSPPCSAAHLQIRVGQVLGAAGNGVTYLIFTDRGSNPCTLRGTPNVQLLDSRGRLLTTPPVRDSSSGYIPTYPNNGVELLPLTTEGASQGPAPEGGVRGQASLPLQYGQDGCNNSVAAIRIEVAGGTFTVPLHIPQPGAQGCEVTRMFVNPFQPAEFLP